MLVPMPMWSIWESEYIQIPYPTHNVEEYQLTRLCTIPYANNIQHKTDNISCHPNQQTITEMKN